MSSFPFYLNSTREEEEEKGSMRKILYERGDGAVTRRHLQIQLENAGVETRDRCRPK
jgi:hypothetical protein